MLGIFTYSSTFGLSCSHTQTIKQGIVAVAPMVPDLAMDPESAVGKRVARYFQTGEMELQLLLGTVTEYVKDEELWHIDYDDGDFEELTANRLRIDLGQYEMHKHEDEP
jgi:hypothetical protein